MKTRIRVGNSQIIITPKMELPQIIKDSLNARVQQEVQQRQQAADRKARSIQRHNQIADMFASSAQQPAQPKSPTTTGTPAAPDDSSEDSTA